MAQAVVEESSHEEEPFISVLPLVGRENDPRPGRVGTRPATSTPWAWTRVAEGY